MLRLSYQTTAPEKVTSLETRAIEYFRQSLTVNDDQEIAHFNLGWLLLESDPEQAERHFRNAAALVPDKGGVYLGRGLACFEQDDSNGMISGLALEVVNDPAFSLAPFWDIPAFGRYRTTVLKEAVSMLVELEAEAVQTIHPRRARYSEVAETLMDLTTDDPPATRLSSQSARVLAVAELAPDLRRQAINRHLVARRHGSAPEEDIQTYLSLFDRNGSDAKAILNDPAGRESPLIRQSRRERPGYGILMRNLDVPLPLDAYIIQRNGIVSDFFPALFPLKGYVSTPDLVKVAELTDGGPTS